jgi:hypothetical protein
MKVKIIREPRGAINGASLKNYRPGEVYDIPSNLAECLVMEKFAIFEMRDRDRSRVPVAVERRKKG